MTRSPAYDAIVVGAGPNGLAAAVHLARSGCRVLVVEANETAGGALRSAPLTLPGFAHDMGSAIHPLCLGSPFLETLGLEAHGLRWVHPTHPVAHPFDDGTAAVLHRSLAETVEGLGPDGAAYERLFAPLVGQWPELRRDLLRPVLRWPRHPLAMAHFGLHAVRSAEGLARRFETNGARALFAGLAAHSFLSLDAPVSAAFGLVLGTLGHVVGWPMPEGGSGRITDALLAALTAAEGEIVTGWRIHDLEELPPAHAVLLDLTPRQALRVAGKRFPAGYRKRLAAYRYGPGVFKVDYALSGPMPWRAEACTKAGTLHLGGTFEEVAAAEAAVVAGRHPERPFVLAVEHTRFDPTRAPAGQHTLWTYCHVPNGSAFDMSARIEAQLERFAPGFRDLVLSRCTSGPADLERQNANLVGGDINGGAGDLFQLIARPVPTPTPYRTPARGLYLCSAATPPGGGVHGMCGYHAAEAVLRDHFPDRTRRVDA